MTDNLFDKFVRDKLGDYSSPVPDKLWQKIEQDMERKRRPAVYWLLAVFMLAAISGGYLFLQNSMQGSGTASADNNLTPVPPQGSSPGAHQTDPAQPGTDAAVVALNNKKNESSSNTLADDNNATQHLNNNNTTDNNTTAHYYSGSNKNNSGVNYSSLSKQNLNASTAALVPNSAFAYNENAETTALGMGEILATDKSNNLYTINSTLNKKSALKMPDIRCPVDRDRGNSDWYIEAYAGPAIATKATQSNTGNNTYLARKDSAEKMQLSYAAGIRLTKPFGDHFMLKAGLQYSQINEKFNYKIENERKQVTVITTHTVINAPGDTTYVKDTSSYEQIGYRERSVKNKFKSVDVPVILGYEWGNDNGWRFAINGGAIFNVYSWYNGEVFDTAFNATNIDKSSTGVYKRNIGVGLYGSISIFKSIGENTELFAEPYFRYNLSNMMEAGQSYSQKFRVGGLSLGVRYKLSGRR